MTRGRAEGAWVGVLARDQAGTQISKHQRMSGRLPGLEAEAPGQAGGEGQELPRIRSM